MALGADYITLAELKTRLGDTKTVDDTKLEGAIAAASDGINNFAGRDFQQETVASARRFRPTTSTLVITQDFHTESDLLIRTDDGDDGTFETTLTSTAYELEPIDGIVNGRTGWPWWKVRLVDGTTFACGRRHTVQVTAQWGWAAVPANIKEAAFILAEDLFKLKDTPFGAGGFGDFGRIRARQNPFVAMMVSDYRRNAVLVG